MAQVLIILPRDPCRVDSHLPWQFLDAVRPQHRLVDPGGLPKIKVVKIIVKKAKDEAACQGWGRNIMAQQPSFRHTMVSTKKMSGNLPCEDCYENKNGTKKQNPPKPRETINQSVDAIGDKLIVGIGLALGLEPPATRVRLTLLGGTHDRLPDSDEKDQKNEVDRTFLRASFSTSKGRQAFAFFDENAENCKEDAMRTFANGGSG